MDKKYVAICEYEDFRIFGNFIKGKNNNSLIEDIFIIVWNLYRKLLR